MRGTVFSAAHFLFPSNKSNVEMELEEKELEKKGLPFTKNKVFKIMNENISFEACIEKELLQVFVFDVFADVIPHLMRLLGFLVQCLFS